MVWIEWLLAVLEDVLLNHYCLNSLDQRYDPQSEKYNISLLKQTHVIHFERVFELSPKPPKRLHPLDSLGKVAHRAIRLVKYSFWTQNLRAGEK